MASVMSIHSCSLAAPIPLKEAKAAGIEIKASEKAPVIPACEKMRGAGQWNDSWNSFFELDPIWTGESMATDLELYASGLMPPKHV
jgi:hypothetical protein